MRTFVLNELYQASFAAVGERKKELQSAYERLKVDTERFIQVQSSDNLINLNGSWAIGCRLLDGR